jgi:hypothetical protein
MLNNRNPAGANGGASEGSLAAKQITQEHKTDGAHAQAQATSESQVVKTIRAHLAKAEKYQGKATEHFIAAGQHLKTLKETSPDQATFLEIVKEQIGLGKSRTYELLQIADGTKTETQIQQANAERKAKERAKLSVTSRTNDDDMPTREEAEESYQQTLRENGQPYDHQSPWAAHGREPPDDDAASNGHTAPEFIRNAPDVVDAALDIIMGMSCQQWQRLMYLLDQHERLPVKGTEEGNAVLDAGRQQLEAAHEVASEPTTGVAVADVDIPGFLDRTRERI